MNTLNLISEKDVAKITGLSLPTLRRWRMFGTGPSYIKLGASVRYREADLIKWIEAQTTGGNQKEVV